MTDLKEKLRMKIPRKIQKRLDTFLHNSEKILHSFQGLFGTHAKGSKNSITSSTVGWGAPKGTQWGSPWLIITKERVLVIGKGLLSVDIREIPLENIKSIDYEQGVTLDKLSFHSHSSIEGIEFSRFDRKYTSQFPKIINNLRKKSTKSEEDYLKILKTRYAKGEITKKEFDKIRKELE